MRISSIRIASAHALGNQEWHQVRVVDQEDAAVISNINPVEGNPSSTDPTCVPAAFVTKPAVHTGRGLHRTGAQVNTVEELRLRSRCAEVLPQNPMLTLPTRVIVPIRLLLRSFY